MGFDLKSLQDTQLKILIELKKICDKHNINFLLAFGTALGAERHGGFIPWDDDIDIFMDLEDLCKLEKICDKELNKEYFFQSTRTDKEYKLLISRIRYNNSTLIEKSEKERDINHGVFIDIYPLFNCPNNKILSYFQSFNAMLYRLILYEKAPVNHGKLINFIGNFVLKSLPQNFKEKLLNRLYDKMCKYKKEKYCSTLYGSIKMTMSRYKVEWFLNSKMVMFEDELMPISAKNDEFLTTHYGNYMKLPKVEDQRIHHDYEFIDLDNPYYTYRGSKYLLEKV